MLEVGADLANLAAQLLLGLVHARLFGALLEVAGLAIEPAHAVDRLVDAIDQALALAVGEAQLADHARDANLLAAHGPLGLAEAARILLLRNLGQLVGQHHRLLVVLVQFVHTAGDVLQPVEENLFGDFLFVEENHFLDGTYAALQVLAHGEDFADHDRRTRQRLQNAKLSALDALGDFDFAFAGEQRHGAHLAQIHADGVVGFLQRTGREIELDVFAGLNVALLELVESTCLRTFEHVNALGADGGHQVFEVVGRMHVVRNEIVHLVIREVALLFSGIDQFLDVVELIF